MRELKTIVHVDDDDDILQIARMALQMVADFEVHQFESGTAALAAVPALKPDLLLLDVMMPGMTGPQAWEAINAQIDGEPIPAVFMTAKAEDEMSQKLLRSGALAVITKPFDPMKLGEQLREAWAKGPGKSAS